MVAMARQMLGSEVMSTGVPWSLEGYRRHNDELAAKYGDPVDRVEKSLAQAREHLRRHGERSDLHARGTELHAAVSALLQAVELGRAGQ